MCKKLNLKNKLLNGATMLIPGNKAERNKK